MTEENQKQIKKPWAVYSYDSNGAWGFGKIVKREEYLGKISRLWITNFEKEGYCFEENLFGCEPLDPEQVKTFDNPLKAMAYFLVHQRKFNPPYDKKSIIKSFLLRFPRERKNLEKLLAQSQPK